MSKKTTEVVRIDPFVRDVRNAKAGPSFFDLDSDKKMINPRLTHRPGSLCVSTSSPLVPLHHVFHVGIRFVLLFMVLMVVRREINGDILNDDVKLEN